MVRKRSGEFEQEKPNFVPEALPKGSLLDQETIRGGNPSGSMGEWLTHYNDPEDITQGKGDSIITPEMEARGLAKKDAKRLKRASIITVMQESFIAYYVASRDRVEAAIQAGYDPGCADRASRHLLNASYFPLVANKIKELFRQQQQVSVMDGAAVLRYIHYAIQFSPADWFLPGRDGGWVIGMDEFRMLPQEVKQLVVEMETRTTHLPDGTSTNSLWVTFVNKNQALALAARYQLGDLNKDATPIVQIDWQKLFGRAPISITQTTTTSTLNVGGQPLVDALGEKVTVKQDVKALTTKVEEWADDSSGVNDDLLVTPSETRGALLPPPEVQLGDDGYHDPIEQRIIELEAKTTKPEDTAPVIRPEPMRASEDKIKDLLSKPKKDRTFTGFKGNAVLHPKKKEDKK